MRHLGFKLLVAVLTFIIGLVVTSALYLRHKNAGQPSQAKNTEQSAAPKNTTEEGASFDPCAFQPPSDRKINADEAVVLAEFFIVQNGYTDLPPIADKSKLAPEAVFPGTDEEGMRVRHDSLERRAYGVISGSRYGDGWTVAFRYRAKPEMVRYYGDRLATIGRAVTMDAYGKGMRVQHQDYFLRMVKKIDSTN